MLLDVHRDHNNLLRTIRDGEPRTATSTFSQLLSSAETRSHTLEVIIMQRLMQEELINRLFVVVVVVVAVVVGGGGLMRGLGWEEYGLPALLLLLF